MKTFLFLLSITLFSFTTEKSFSQQKVTIEEDRMVPVDEVFNIIQKQTKYRFIYPEDLFANMPKVKLKKGAIEVSKLLEQSLLGGNFNFKLSGDNNIIIKENIKTNNANSKVQKRRISGKITNQAGGQPLSGANILEKGTTNVAQSDYTGNFSLELSSENAVLVVTYIGFDKQEVKVNGRTTVNISLKESTGTLNDVVVVGYGTVKRKDITGSVASVSMTDIIKAPVRSFDEALAGRVAGVQVSSGDGQPGAGINIVIRGNNSVTQSNAPLYVIDGFPIEGMDNNSLNPQDIETIDILKDASATAIYGARGANGVIVITTKKGKVGKPVFTFMNTTAIQQLNNKVQVMDPYEFVKMQIERDPTPIGAAPFKSPTQLYLPPGRTIDSYKTMEGDDWQDKTLKSAFMNTYDLSVSGGTQKTKYFLSGNVVDQDGIVINSNYIRYQGRLTLDHQFSKKFKVGINTNYSYTNASGNVPSQNTGSYSNYTMYSIWGYRPITGYGTSSIDPDTELTDPDINRSADYRVQPVINLENQLNERVTNNLIANGYLEYEFIPSLKLRVTGGIVDTKNTNNIFNNHLTSGGMAGSVNGINGRIMRNNTQNLLNENTLTWSKTYNKHSINTLGGFTMQKGTSENYGVIGNFLPNEEMGLDALQYDTPLEYQGVRPKVDNTHSVWTMASFLGRVNYNYDSRYLLTASMRADGSSKFSSKNHWGYFPSGAFSWRFKNEKFLKKNKTLSDGKFRASYGETGNNRVGDFDYLTKFNSPYDKGYVFNNEYVDGIVTSNLGNENLKWETTAQTNFGIDLGFFNQRITFVADVYKKETKDLLLKADLPASSGYLNASKNVGSMENKGLELTLNTVNVKTPTFSWSTSFNISFNENKITGLADNQTELKSNIYWDVAWQNVPYSIAKVGEPIGQMYGYVYEGTYKTSMFDYDASGTPLLKLGVPDNGNVRTAIRPGDIKFKDINGDGKLTADDAGVIGHTLPKHVGGFTNNFTYKGFDLNVFFQWSYGNDLMNTNRILFEGGSNNANLNMFATYADRWNAGNPDSNIPRLGGTTAAIAGYSTRTIEDGSYIRLKTVSFGYNFDEKLVSKFKMKSLRLYTSAQNLITWTKYTGMDPEVSTYSSALVAGFDFSAYPRARTIAIGARASF
ncbi:SusC/RagA family TonB-linked outer membrane protein [Flavobacterium sp. WC2509]|uniref:SusC/RagA family TonB-linked outer membrane protein n=1 Tax=Flavobacterium sp. WC2509 TaxID=3461406 RepID=UPI004044512F